MTLFRPETPYEDEPLPRCDYCGQRATRELVPGVYACSAYHETLLKEMLAGESPAEVSRG